MSYERDLVTATTGTGIVGSTFDVAVSGTPKWLRVTMIGLAGGTNRNLSWGLYAAGSNTQGCLVGQSTSGVAGQVDSHLRLDSVLIACNASGALVGRMAVQSISANNVRFVIGVQFPSDFTFILETHGGSDIGNTKVMQVNLPTTTGAGKVENSIGFIPLYGQFLCAGEVSALPQGPTGLHRLSIGQFTTNPVKNQVMHLEELDTSGNTDTGSYSLDTECISFSGNTSSPGLRYAVDGTTAGGITFNCLEQANGNTYRAIGLFVDGTFQVEMGTTTTPTNGTPVSLGGSITPLVGNAWSHCRTKSTVDVISAGAEASFGSWLDSGMQNVISLIDVDNVNPATNSYALDTSNVYQNFNSAGSVEGLGSITASKTITMSTPDPSASFLSWVMFAAAPTFFDWSTTVQRQRVLQAALAAVPEIEASGPFRTLSPGFGASPVPAINGALASILLSREMRAALREIPDPPENIQQWLHHRGFPYWIPSSAGPLTPTQIFALVGIAAGLPRYSGRAFSSSRSREG